MILVRKKIPSPGILFSLLVSFLFLHVQAYSQPEDWNIRYYTTADGLSSNHLNCVIKDHNGFLWIGADNGLNRFDGYNFKMLSLPSGDPHPLNGIEILSIFEDRDSILWIGTSDGLFRYNTSETVSEIKQYRYYKGREDQSYRFYQPVNEICEDKNGLLWMVCIDIGEGVNFGLRTFDKAQEQFNYITVDSSFRDRGEDESIEPFIGSIYSDRQGDLWFGSQWGLIKYDFETETFRRILPDPGSDLPGVNNVFRMMEDRAGNFWITSGYGLRIFDRDRERFGELFFIDDIGWVPGTQFLAYEMREDQNGYPWFRINQKLVRILPAQKGQQRLSALEYWETGYTTAEIDPLVSLLVEDPWNVWFSVSDHGLCHLTVKRNRFRKIVPPVIAESGTNKLEYISSVYLDGDHDLWVSSYTGRSTRIDLQNSVTDDFYPIPLPFILINSIDRDEFGNFWFAIKEGVLARAVKGDNDELGFTFYIPDPANPASLTRRNEFYFIQKGSVASHLYEHLLFKDEHGTLWFNSGRGIHDRYDPVQDGFFHLDHRQVDLFNNDSCVEARIEGEIWFPSLKGLLRLLPPFTVSGPSTLVPRKAILYTNIPGDTASLNSSWIRTIHFSRNYEPGTLWIGTAGGGLNKMESIPIKGTDRYRIAFSHFAKDDGLCDNSVLGILEDDRGNLWLSTLNGLSKFDPRTWTCNNFYELDGLPTDQFSWADPCMSPSGEMFFPTESGVVAFHPDSIRINRTIPPVVITDIKVFNESIYPDYKTPSAQNNEKEGQVELNYNQNFLSFEFAALNFEQPEKNQYRYKLENLDRDWIHVVNRRFAEYTGLRPGKYLFRVQGSNNFGIWNEKGASLQIIIHPPPWLSWWAYLIYALVIALVVIRYRRFLLNRAKLRASVELERFEKEKLQEMDRMKSRFLANISHEFRTPLTLILGPAESTLKKRKNDPESQVFEGIIKNAKRLLRLVGQLLDISKMESGSLRLKVSKGDLKRLIKSIILTYSSLAESKKVEYLYDLPMESPIVCFDSDKIEKIIGNLISNAIKFTPSGGTVKVACEFIPSTGSVPESIIITVSDTGVGIPLEVQDRIFDRFYRVSDSDSREVEGTGIGLALTRELVDLWRGQLTVQSEPGKGSTFSVLLPVNREHFRVEELEKDSGGEPVRERLPVPGSYNGQELTALTGKEKMQGDQNDAPVILIVEDNIELIHFIADILGDYYHILTADNGRSGLERAIENIPDLVISDVMMPEMDGQEMCKLLREDSRTNHIPVIMLTAKADRNSKLEGLATGANDYLVKPFDPEELLVRIRNLVEQRRKLREKFMLEFISEPDRKRSLSPDDRLLRKILDIINRYIPDPGFDMDQMAGELNMSRSQLFRKVRAVTGHTPNDLLRVVRLKRAANLFKHGHKNISRVMYEVGFNNQSYFSGCFRDLFKMNPSEYIKSKSTGDQ